MRKLPAHLRLHNAHVLAYRLLGLTLTQPRVGLRKPLRIWAAAGR